MEQCGVPQQYGVRKDRENSGGADSRKGATERGVDVVQDDLAQERTAGEGDGSDDGLEWWNEIEEVTEEAEEEEVSQVEDVSENGDEVGALFNPLFGVSFGLRSAPNLLG